MGGVVLIIFVGDMDVFGNIMYYGMGFGGVKGWFVVFSVVQVVVGDLIKMVGMDGVLIFGLFDVFDLGVGILLVMIFDVKGCKIGSWLVIIIGIVNQIVVMNGDVVAGVLIIFFVDFVDMGVGVVLVKFLCDVKGCVLGIQVVMMIDFVEGVNFYFINVCVDVWIIVQKGQLNGIVSLDVGGKVFVV